MWNKILIIAALAAFASCGGYRTKPAETRAETTSVDMHNAENSLDYEGIYAGTIPAADCPGIEVCLVLYSDSNYQLNMVYLERDTGFDERGIYAVTGNTLTLNPSKDDPASQGDRPSYYKIEEGQLRMLDNELQVIEGPLADNYILKKVQ